MSLSGAKSNRLRKPIPRKPRGVAGDMAVSCVGGRGPTAYEPEATRDLAGDRYDRGAGIEQILPGTPSIVPDALVTRAVAQQGHVDYPIAHGAARVAIAVTLIGEPMAEAQGVKGRYQNHAL